jgi:hypothetical protein
MKAAFEIKRHGLRHPLTKVAGLIRQRDDARREAEELRATLGGTNPFAGRLGESVPPLEGKTERPALPQPKKPRRKKGLPYADSGGDHG